LVAVFRPLVLTIAPSSRKRSAISTAELSSPPGSSRRSRIRPFMPSAFSSSRAFFSSSVVFWMKLLMRM
jgi:hypothetical protein